MRTNPRIASAAIRSRSSRRSSELSLHVGSEGCDPTPVTCVVDGKCRSLEIGREPELKRDPRARWLEAPDDTEVEGDALPNLVVATALDLKLPAVEPELRCVGAGCLHAELQGIGEVVDERPAAGEDEAALAGPDRAGGLIADELQTAVEAKHRALGDRLLRDRVEIDVRQSRPQPARRVAGGKLDIEGGRERGPRRVWPRVVELVLQSDVRVADPSDRPSAMAPHADNRQQGAFETEFKPVQDAVVDLEVRGVLAPRGTCRPLEIVELVGELEVKPALSRHVGVVGVEGLLGADWRRVEKENNDYRRDEAERPHACSSGETPTPESDDPSSLPARGCARTP